MRLGGETGRRGKAALLSVQVLFLNLRASSLDAWCGLHYGLWRCPFFTKDDPSRDCSSAKQAGALPLHAMARNGRFCPPSSVEQTRLPGDDRNSASPVSCPLPWGPWNWILPWDPYSFATPRVTPWRRWGSGGPERFPHISPVASLAAGKDGVCGLMADGQHYPEDTWGKP